jgi:hypothetical protein
MSEQQTEVQEGAEPQAGKEAETFDAEYVSKLRKESAKYRTEAKANADAAKRLAEIEEAQKTAEQKAAERESAAIKRAEEAEARALRRDVALEHSLSKDDAALLDDLTDEEAMRRLATRLAGAASDKRKNGNHVPREGASSSPESSDERQFVSDLFGGD